MNDIFFSYSRKDSERAEQLTAALERMGWSLFWDRNIPAGTTWEEHIGVELDGARCVLVGWSEAAVASEFVREEAREGKERKVLIPISWEPIKPPFGFRGVQTVDLSRWQGDPKAREFRALLRGLDRILGPPPNRSGDEATAPPPTLPLRRARGQARRTECPEMRAAIPDYSIKYLDLGFQSKRDLPTEFASTADAIVQDLAEDPDRYPGRTVAVSADDPSTLVYTHPAPAIQAIFRVDRETKLIVFLHFAAPRGEGWTEIAIYYSHADERWVREIEKYLTDFVRRGLLQLWDVSELEPGSDSLETIRQSLGSVKVAILLVSQDFLVSALVTELDLVELLDRADTEGKRILWLPARPSTLFDSHPGLAQLECLLESPTVSLEEMDEAERRRMLVQIRASLERALEQS